MPESARFVAYAVDLLSLLGDVRARAMFGGHGIYAGELMIGLVDDDEIFLKTDEVSLPRFLEAGCRAWVYESRGKAMQTSYFRPPDEAHEEPEAMLPWARLALEAARRAAAAKAAKKSGRASPKRGGKEAAAKPRAAKRRSAPRQKGSGRRGR